MEHSHDETQWPIIWEVRDLHNSRLTVLIAHSAEEAQKLASQIYKPLTYYLHDTGKRKPPNKCCNKCGNKPCG